VTTTRDNSLGEGVFYAEQDHAGFVRRLVVIAIDLATLLLVGVALWYGLLAIMWFGLDRDPNPVFWVVWPLCGWVYLGIINWQRSDTFGILYSDGNDTDLPSGCPFLMTRRWHVMTEAVWRPSHENQRRKSGRRDPCGPRPPHHLACGSAPGGSTKRSKPGCRFNSNG